MNGFRSRCTCRWWSAGRCATAPAAGSGASDDLIVRLGEPGYPPITGVLVQTAVLELLSRVQCRRVRALLGYDPATAGGLMSPDVVFVDRHATVAEAQAKVRTSLAPAELVTVVFAVDTHGAIEVWLPVATALGPSAAQPRMFTARATTNPTVSRAATDWMPITTFAVCVSGIVSVGLNAVAFVNDVYR
jgi:hypothetical protein